MASLLRAEPGRGHGSITFHPSYTCVFLYRLSFHFYQRGHRLWGRFFWHLNMILTGADISPVSDLGPGLVIVNPVGVTLDGHAGKNLTVMPLSGLGSELGRLEDTGAGPALPRLGDDVYLAPHSGVLGPVRIGDRVRLAAGVIVTSELPDDAVVEPFATRFLVRNDLL